MKIIALGDTHGRSYWRAVAENKEFDKLVLLGDYFDSPDISAREQMDNFLEIAAYKIANPGRVILLIGNHDFHYLPVAVEAGEQYTGFQYRHAASIGKLLLEHLHLLQACYKSEDYLFTHAGVTHTWLNNAGHSGGQVDLFINELFHRQPQAFLFSGSSPDGDNVTQSPIWVRPASLMKNAFSYQTIKQVVGHTSVSKINVVKDRYFFIDALGSSREYLVLDEGRALFNKI